MSIYYNSPFIFLQACIHHIIQVFPYLLKIMQVLPNHGRFSCWCFLIFVERVFLQLSSLMLSFLPFSSWLFLLPFDTLHGDARRPLSEVSFNNFHHLPSFRLVASLFISSQVKWCMIIFSSRFFFYKTHFDSFILFPYLCQHDHILLV